MANKYKDYSKQVDVKAGEIALTYGVTHLNNPEYKPYRHAQQRPYLVLDKTESGKILALKMTSKLGGYLAEFKIDINKISQNDVITRTSAADMRTIYELSSGDFIKNGILLDDQTLRILYSKMIKLYCVIKNSNLTPEQAKYIFNKYMESRSIHEGTVIKVKDLDVYLYVLKATEGTYKCLPLYKESKENTHDSFLLNYKVAYIDYNQTIEISHEEVCYIISFNVSKPIQEHIKGCYNSYQKFILGKSKNNG